MNQVLLQTADRSISEFQQFADTFVEREAALMLIRQLNRLVKAVQRHRGISLGLLAGNTDYQSEFTELRTELERRLAMLEVFAAANRLLSQKDKQNLADAWATIRNDWEDDNLNDNFELHSHLIHQLLKMIENLAEVVSQPIAHTEAGQFGEGRDLDANAGQDGEDRAAVGLGAHAGADGSSKHGYTKQFSDQRVFMMLICSTLPKLVEDIARVRGTVSYLIAVGKDHGFDETKIRFWVNSVGESTKRLNAELGELAERQFSLPWGNLVERTELMLKKLMGVVESVGFLGHASLTGSSTIFDMATEVIENYWEMVNRGLNVAQQWHINGLDDWMQGD